MECLIVDLGCNSPDDLVWVQRNQRKHSSFCSLGKQPIPGSCTICYRPCGMRKRSMIANQQRNWGTFMLSGCWTVLSWGHGEILIVWTPTFPFGAFGQFLSSGQSLCVPAGTGSICPVTWFRPKCAKFELWEVGNPERRMRPSYSVFPYLPSTAAIQRSVVLPVAALGWQSYLCGAKGGGIPTVYLQSLCNLLWPICVLWKMFMPR